VPDDAPPPDQECGILRACFEALLFAGCVLLGVLLAGALSFLIFLVLLDRPRPDDFLGGLDVVWRVFCWLAPFGALLGAVIGCWLVRLTRRRWP